VRSLIGKGVIMTAAILEGKLESAA
jgi:hypothetical protein